METPLVSVMLPFYNAGRFFPLAVRSILEQRHTNLEFLLCDDGSNDGSLEYARQIPDSRVVVWSDGKTKGLASRLNECLGRARGSLIARMDSDDISYPDRLLRQVEFMQRNPEVDLLGCRMLICGEENQPIGKRPLSVDHEAIVAHPALGFGMGHPTWMGRADWYRKHLYDARAIRFEDCEILYRSHPYSRFANLPDILLGYRELRGGFQKRWHSRCGRIRYLRARRQELGTGLYLRAASAEAVRVAMDAGLALTSSRYLMMKLREEKLTGADIAEWQAVLDGLAAASEPTDHRAMASGAIA